MKKSVFTISSFVLIATIAVMPSCKRKGCTESTAINFDEEAKRDDGSCEFDNYYTVPATYSFADANGNNTVSFSGQQQRLDMLSEMVTYMKTANTAGVQINAATLKSMYANSGYTWTDANSLGMTGSSKQLKSKTAEADAGIQAQFEAYMDSIAALSATTTNGVENGSSTQGGVWPNDGSKGPYLMTAQGIEYAQLIEKGLMAAVFMNQMTVNYLTDLDADDNTSATDATAGKYYTTMEHHWDEAYGYFSYTTDFPTTGTDRFWGKYASSREGVLGSATKIATAFRTGRAAIANKDYTTRDAQVKIIRDEIEKVCAGTAIHYLNAAKANIGKSTTRNHSLSEAWAFIEGLKYGYNSINGVSISTNQIETALNYIGKDFNAVTITGLQNAIDLIAANTGLEAVKSSL